MSCRTRCRATFGASRSALHLRQQVVEAREHVERGSLSPLSRVQVRNRGLRNPGPALDLSLGQPMVQEAVDDVFRVHAAMLLHMYLTRKYQTT